ncbi:ATP-binding cassette domain-containing protein [Corynebacterium sp. CNJ-954]|uniref:ABC transporter ATP-binding protein n=1 Tax=Corynebacterium sp. CNJ-954 TaxID=1904962 RepID=UPI00096AAF0B|nr:ATP-binding cassette domain-containing protein [Corynebacterium sp. CNJ-954]
MLPNSKSEIRIRGLVLKSSNKNDISIPDYTFRSGTLTAVSGKNGAGKTSLLYAISGAIRQKSGTIEFVTDRKKNRRRTISAHMPAVSLCQSSSIKGILETRRTFTDFSENRCRAVWNSLGVQVREGSSIASLSSGEYNKISIGLTLGHNSDIIILDEPEKALDNVSRGKVNKLLVEAATRGTIVIATTHSTELLQEEYAENLTIPQGN